MKPRAAALDDAQAARRADRELLSLALIDARNHTLRWLAAFEAREALLAEAEDGPASGIADAGRRDGHGAGDGRGAAGPDGRDAGAGRRGARDRPDGRAAAPSPLALAARAGAWQDRWIARNVRRQQGEAATPSDVRLPPADAAIDAWLGGAGAPPSVDALRGWLGQTLETTLDLLAAARDDDAGLFVFRAALRHEDRLGEAMAERAAALQLHAGGSPALPWHPPGPLPRRGAVWLPAQRFALGSVPDGGAVPENERWAHEVAVPEFEIDAQPVVWADYVEFAEDGGYDRRDCWSDAGWAWLQDTGRRAPRHVEQLRGGVVVQRHGELVRAGATQPALHVTRHEAQAWCRWAGRRLPTEPEWELAALAGAGRGFAWGEVFEWVAGSAHAWPGHTAGACALDALPPAERRGVLRGGSSATRRRQLHPKARRFAPPEADAMFCGFRSCAV